MRRHTVQAVHGHDRSWYEIMGSPPPPPAAGGTTRTARLNNSGFDGVVSAFTDLLPSEPELTTNDVILIHGGVGPLKRVAGAPVAGEFQLSGATNRTVTFGFPPELGDQVYAIYVQA